MDTNLNIETPPEQKDKIGPRILPYLFIIGIIAILAAFTIPDNGCHLKSGPLTKATHNLKQLSILFLQYEQTYGHYPAHPEELYKKELIHKQTYFEFLQQLPEMEGNWWYNPHAKQLSTNSDPETVLIISPQINKKRVKLRIDGSAKQFLADDSTDKNFSLADYWIAIAPLKKDFLETP